MALRYLVSGGDGNWSNTSNWSATSGGASGASAPGSADDVFFDVNSGNVNLTVTVNSSYKSLTVSDYTGTVFLDANLTASSPGSTTSTSVFTIQSLSVDTNVTANGKYLQFSTNSSNPATHNLGSIIFNTGLLIGASVANQAHTHNMLTSFTINGFLGFSNNTAPNFGTNSITIYLNGSYLDFTTGSSFGSHNTTIEFINTFPVVMSTTKTAGTTQFNFTFNSTSSITKSGYFLWTLPRLISWIQGTVTVDSTSKLVVANTSFTFNTGPIIWNDLIMSRVTTLTITLQSSFILSGTFSIGVPTGGSGTNPINFVSSSPGTSRKLTYLGTNQSLFYGLASVDIDSRDGNTIWTMTNPGVNPSGLNWKRLVAPTTFASTFIN